MRDPALHTTTEMRDDADVTRNVLVRLLVTPEERDVMQKAADREGLTMSEWVRQCCFITTTTTTIEPKAITPPSIARSRSKSAAVRRSVRGSKAR